MEILRSKLLLKFSQIVFGMSTKNNVIAGIHAGWRGSAGHITTKMIQLMKERWKSNTSEIIAYLGPSAGVCCYEVGEEVAGLFSSEFIAPKANDKYHLDIPAVNKQQLISAGVKIENIEHENPCTICSGDRFHSYRRDGIKCGRMMGVIGIRG